MRQCVTKMSRGRVVSVMHALQIGAFIRFQRRKNIAIGYERGRLEVPDLGHPRALCNARITFESDSSARWTGGARMTVNGPPFHPSRCRRQNATSGISLIAEDIAGIRAAGSWSRQWAEESKAA